MKKKNDEPTYVPSGMGLVIFHLLIWDKGFRAFRLNSMRYFAMQKGRYDLLDLEYVDHSVVVQSRSEPTIHEVVSGGGISNYALPKGSLEYVQGHWVSCKVLRASF
jgi:hypothetical protein